MFRLGALATSLPIGAIVGGAPPTPVTAPVLSLENAGAWPPVVNVDVLDDTAVAGNGLRLQGASDFGFSSLTVNVLLDTSALSNVGPTPELIVASALSGISSPTETFFRARFDGPLSPWSNIVKHGDVTAPSITSSASPSAVENTLSDTTLRSGSLTASETIASWEKIGGADASAFDLVGSTWTLNVQTDYEVKSSYVVQWRATDLAGNATTQTMTLSITDADEIPNSFSVSNLTGQTRSATVESAEVTIGGLGSGVIVPISVSGTGSPKYAIDTGSGYGAFTNAAGTIQNGHKVKRQLVCSASYSSAVSNILTIGGGSHTWTATTEADASVTPSLTNTAARATNVAYAANHVEYSGVAIGAADGSRVLYIAVWGSDGSPTAPDVNGAAATIVGSVSGDGRMALYKASVPTGTTATIDVKFAGSQGSVMMQVFSAIALPTLVAASIMDWGFRAGVDQQQSVTTPSGGKSAIAAFVSYAEALGSWNNASAGQNAGPVPAFDVATDAAVVETAGTANVGPANFGNKNTGLILLRLDDN